MKKLFFIIIMACSPFIINAQNGEIQSFNVIGMDYYPSGPKLNTEVTIKYSQARQGQIYLILYADNAPLKMLYENKTYQAYNKLAGKMCIGYTILSPTSNVITNVFRIQIPIKYKRLSNGISDDFYLQAALLDSRNSKLIHTNGTQIDISKLKIANHQESTNSPQEKAKRRQEYIAKINNSEQRGNAGSLLGALFGGGGSLLADDALCINCHGAGCSVCNGTGRDNTASYFAKSGFEAGLRLAKQSNSEKVLNGNHTVTYSDGTYSGNFKDGLRHGKGTFTCTSGEKYVGDWEHGNMTGNGTLTGSNGFKYIGEFVENKMHGNGELHVGGNTYKGWFHQGDMNGIGTLYYNKEKIYIKGIWEDGELVKELKRGKITSSKASTQPRKTSSAKSNRK